MVAIPASEPAPVRPGAPSPTAPAPANTGGAVARQPNPGNQDQALKDFAAAAALMTRALPAVPMGTPFHQKALKLLTDINKLMEEAKSDARPSDVTQSLLSMARKVHQTAPMQALARIAPANAAAGAPPATATPAASAA